MQRWTQLAWASAIFYAVLLSFCWSALSHRAEVQTESMLNYAMIDVDATFMAAIDTMLMHAAESIVQEFGEPSAQTDERMELVARQRDMDEINLAARDGTILASTDKMLVGKCMANHPSSAEFLVLTDGVHYAFSQPFRAGAHNPNVKRKYVGVAFPGGNGYVQVGIDETRVTRMFPSITDFIFDSWQLGEHGFLLCADMTDGHLLSNPARHRDEANTLAETGYDTNAPGVVEDGKTTFKMRLFGEMHDCRAAHYCGHLIIAALPPNEYYSTRTFYATVMGVVLAAMMILFVTLIRRIDIASDSLKAFYSAEDERRAKEYAVAQTIQNSAMPAPLPENKAFKLDASMQTAKEVGGDFYDYFMLDLRHLAFLVADVSGKGISGALYMMTAKTLIRDTMLDEHDPAKALTLVNGELCRNNSANMFLTAWVGVLDLDTGIITYVNAGHNPPAKIGRPEARGDKDDGTAQQTVSFVWEKSGPVLAFVEGAEYKAHTLRLASGDSLFLYTDGVTEATDAQNVLFGEERLADTLKSAGRADPHSICTIVRMAVAAFSQSMAQTDDITVMALQYKAEPRRLIETFPPTQDGIAAASDWLDGKLPALGLDEDKTDMQSPALHVILDEICSNIVKHSKATNFEVALEAMEDLSGVKMFFIDDGIPYNPLKHADPDISLKVEDRPIGGLGIMMVKKMASSMRYLYGNGKNHLIVERKI